MAANILTFTFTAEQMERIKALYEAGKIAEAQALIVAIIEGRDKQRQPGPMEYKS